MSTPSVSIAQRLKPKPAPLALWRWRLLGFALSSAIVALAIGPGGRAGVLRLARTAAWAPHAPRLSLLTAQSLALQLHVATIVAAFLVGTVLMLRVKGTRLHKALGWTWVALMTTTAVAALFIRSSGMPRWSLLHVFVAVTAVTLSLGLAAIRRGDVARHARWMTGLYFGGLIGAGVLAFMPGRLMWRMVFG